MWATPKETADLVTFTEEILSGKLHFSCSAKFRLIIKPLKETNLLGFLGVLLEEYLSWKKGTSNLLKKKFLNILTYCKKHIILRIKIF